MLAPSRPNPSTIAPHIAGSGTADASDQLLNSPKSDAHAPVAPVHQGENGPAANESNVYPPPWKAT
jgi:hypothetical protein